VKIVNLTPHPGRLFSDHIQAVSDLTDVRAVDLHQQTEAKIMEEVADADIIVPDYLSKTPITENIAKAAKNVKLIQTVSAGFEYIDLEICRRSNIKVSNLAGGNAPVVAEHTIMLLLALLRNLIPINNRTHQAEWPDKVKDPTQGLYGLIGRVVGLLGMGQIARAVAERLAPFRTRTIYYSRSKLSSEDEKRYSATYADFKDLLKKADAVCIHLPLSEETRNIIGASEIALMKNTAIIINMGRGGLVDEEALARAIREKRIRGAGLDVFSEEPIARNNPLIGLDHVILTPHCGGSAPESFQNMLNLSVENMIRAYKGEEPYYVVNR